MTYKTRVNLNASGVKMNAGDIYVGPEELIKTLLASGVLEEADTTLVVGDPVVVTEPKPKRKRKPKDA